jgi:hypothetical protein
MKTPFDMKAGTIFKTNKYGDLEVVKYNGKYDVMVKFFGTNSIIKSQSSHIRAGTVKDKLKPIIYGVGFFGVGDHFIPRNTKAESPYTTWHNMLRRCYDAEFHKAQPTYKDCTVCRHWHNYQNFAKWYIANYPTTKGDWQIDKDILSGENKHYSPDTCLFVPRKENMNASLAKDYSFISPEGMLINIHNLSDFCKENSLHPSHMSAVHKEKLKHHKKWTKA